MSDGKSRKPANRKAVSRRRAMKSLATATMMLPGALVGADALADRQATPANQTPKRTSLALPCVDVEQLRALFSEKNRTTLKRAYRLTDDTINQFQKVFREEPEAQYGAMFRLNDTKERR